MPRRLVDLREQAPLLDIVSYGRRSPGTRPTFSSAERDHIGRTVRGVPEVMIKVSGGGKSAGAVAAHFWYIDRKGELDIETDDGDRCTVRGPSESCSRTGDCGPMSSRRAPTRVGLAANQRNLSTTLCSRCLPARRRPSSSQR